MGKCWKRTKILTQKMIRIKSVEITVFHKIYDCWRFCLLNQCKGKFYKLHSQHIMNLLTPMRSRRCLEIELLEHVIRTLLESKENCKNACLRRMRDISLDLDSKRRLQATLSVRSSENQTFDRTFNWLCTCLFLSWF